MSDRVSRSGLIMHFCFWRVVACAVSLASWWACLAPAAVVQHPALIAAAGIYGAWVMVGFVAHRIVCEVAIAKGLHETQATRVAFWLSSPAMALALLPWESFIRAEHKREIRAAEECLRELNRAEMERHGVAELPIPLGEAADSPARLPVVDHE